jgi:hypothetical protein
MSSVAPPPNPCLVSIILVVESLAGPRFVYHYPPNPLSERSSSQRRGSYRDDDSSSSSSDDSSSSEDDDTNTIGASSLRPHVSESDFALSLQQKRARNLDEDEDDTSSPEGEESYISPWETVLGFRTNALQKLLCPTRTWHKRRFEFAINDLAFIGWPVFVREDGTWQKRKQRRKKRWRQINGAEAGNKGVMNVGGGQENGDDNDEGLVVSEDDNVITDGDEDVRGTEDQPRKSPGSEVAGSACKETMTMFNVVFVLNPTPLEYPFRIKEMYENVVKKFARALKWEQSVNNYVWKESQTILSLKEKAREDRTLLSILDADIRRESSLARAFAEVYKYISASQIASVSFSSADSISLQIPPITSISVLPSATETPLPGVWLTTADSVTSPADDPSVIIQNPSVGSVQLAKHFALLLLDSEASILKSLEPSAVELATAMAHYVQRSTPTKSFAQISALYNIPLHEIQVLASHLVYWRRARAIPPLHQRDTYIVSPNADLRKLSSASAAYSATFPALPSLPRMLSLLSGPPRNYGCLIPSKDHKDTYFQILAWLLRGGWVTQLRTFAWIRISGDVKRAVAEQMAKEDVERQKDASVSISTSSTADSTSPTTTESPPISRSSTAAGSHHSSSNPRPSAAYLRGSIPTQQLSLPNPPGASQQTACLLLSPHRATPLESRWLDYLASSFPTSASPSTPPLSSSPKPAAPTEDKPQSQTPQPADSPPNPNSEEDDLNVLWPIFTKYLNGHDALEKIAVREGMKRKRVWKGLLGLAVLDGPSASSKDAGSGDGAGKEKGRSRLGMGSSTGDQQQGQGQGGNAGEDGDAEAKKVLAGRRVVGVRHW